MKAKAFESSLSIVTLYSPLYYSDQEELCHNTNSIITVEHNPDIVCTSNRQNHSQAVLISPINSPAMPKKAFSHQNIVQIKLLINLHIVSMRKLV